MHKITDIYFVGGFGTVQWIDVGEYLTATPDAIATNQPRSTLAVRGRPLPPRMQECTAFA